MTSAKPLFHNAKTAQNADHLPSASVNAFTIESGESFVDVLADHLLAAYEQDDIGLSRVRILLPTRRACTALREAFLRRTSGRAVLLPFMTPVFAPEEDELYFLSGLDVADLTPPIDPTKRLLLLMPLIKRAFPESLNTQQALALAQHLASFIDELYIENLQLDDLDRLAPDDPDLAANWQKTVRFLKDIIAQYWPPILEAHGCTDIGAYRVKLIEAYTQHWKTQPPQDPVIIAGTLASVPALAEMIGEILKSPQGYLILPALDKHMDGASWDACAEGHPQYLFKQLLHRLNLPREDVRILKPQEQDQPRYAATPPQLATKQADARRHIASEMMRPPATLDEWQNTINKTQQSLMEHGLHGLSLLEVKNPFQEARAIACIIREALDMPDHTVMVITPNRKLAALIQKEMLLWGIELDDSAGTPLAQTGLGRWFLAFLRLMQEQYSPLALLGVLKNGFFRGGANWPQAITIPDFITQFEKDLLRGLRRYQDFASLDKAVQEKWAAQAPKMLEAWDALKPSLAALNDGLAQEDVPLESVLRLILTQMEALAATPTHGGDTALWLGDTGEQAASFFSNLLDAVRGETATTLGAAAEFFQHMLEGVSVRPKYGMHPRIRLLGLAEARLQTADTVVLAGLNEGSWPRDPGHNPWMSRPMIKEYGFPSPERALSQSAHDFIQGFCCPRVFLTRALSMEGALAVPSRWISRFKTVLQATDAADAVQSRAQPYIQKALLLPLPDTRSEPLTRPAPVLPENAGIERLSITDAGALQTDPYAFYAKRILRLRPLDPLDQQPDALLRGQILHEGLERFTKAFPHALPADPYAELVKIGEDLFQAFVQWNADIHAFWWPRYLAMAAWFAAYEQNWRQNGNLIFAEVEGGAVLETARCPVHLAGRADRIEKHQDGWVVIDYKTGQPPSNTDIAMGYMPQLPLTAALITRGGFADLDAHKQNMGDAAQQVSGLYYWKISGADSEAKTIDPSKFAKQDITEFCQTCWDGLHDLLHFYNDEGGAFYSYPLGSQTGAPFSADYQHLSRVSEWAVADDQQDTEAAA